MFSLRNIYKGVALASVAVLCACSENDVNPDVTEATCPTEISMVISEDLQKYIYEDNSGMSVLPMLKGQSAELGVSVGPDSCTYKDVMWVSSTPSVASVTEGKVEALSSEGTGYSVISVLPAAMAEASGVVAKLKVTVDDKLIPATGITLSADTAEIYEGEQLALSYEISPENTTYRTLTWSSSDESVATVDLKGVVTGKKVHSGDITTPVTIKGTALDGSKVFGKFTVKIRKPVTPTSVSIDQKYSSGKYACCATERSLQLAYTAQPAECTKSQIEWSSSDENLATVENGVVYFNQDGNFGDFTITAKCPGGKTSSIRMSLPAGLIRETFSNPKDYTWDTGVSGTSQVVDGHLQVTTIADSYYRQDFKCTEPATYICPANYPIIAVRMTDVKDLDYVDARNLTFDTSGKDLSTGTKYSGAIGNATNKYTKDIKCKDGSHVFYYDLTTAVFQKAPDTAGLFPANGDVGMFTTFQFKYADFKKAGANVAVPVTYSIYWVQSFRNAAECVDYLKSQGLVD